MGNLTQLGRQLSAIWTQLGPSQRVTVAAGSAAVLAALLFVGYWSSRVDYGLLYGKLDEAESAKVIAVLDEGKIPYEVREGPSLYVPADQVHEIRMQLASRGVPRGEGVGYEIFDKPNFGLSEFAQRTNFKRALQGELARTIGRLDDVESARVMIVMPENRLLVDSDRKPTASVFVQVRGQTTLSPQSINSIRFLVANAVEGLQVGNVSVVDNRGTVLSENAEEDSLNGLTTQQLNARRNLEQYLAKKAQGMLETVLGPGQAVVRVSAEINLDSITRVEERFDPEGQVARSTTTDDENTETLASSATGGAPGVSANTAIDTNFFAATPLNNTRTRKTTSQSEYEINKTTSNTTQLAGGIRKVTAAVLVAAKLEGEGAERKTVPRTTEEMAKLRRIVQSALGMESANPVDPAQITLEEMPFTEPLAGLAADLDRDSSRQFWVSLALKLIYPALAVALFGAFFLMLKRTPALPVTLATSATGATGGRFHSLAGSHGETLGTGGHRPHQPAVVTVEVFNQLMKENPDNMNQAIQSWLAGGSSPKS